MATASDACTAIASALAEIGVTGEVQVTMDGDEAEQGFGEPSGDDVKVVVTVQSRGDG